MNKYHENIYENNISLKIIYKTLIVFFNVFNFY